MHRHGYKGKKFNRERDQRRALIKGLADSLVKYESIETTMPKAKELVPYVEHLITKAKKGDLHNRRQIISSLQTTEAAHKLIDEITPKLTKRTSGHLRVAATRTRRGDNSQLARVSFVDDLKEAPVSAPAKQAVDSKPDNKDAQRTPAAKDSNKKATIKSKTKAKS